MSNAFNASVVYNMKVSGHFATENYGSRLDVVQNFSCLIFWNILSKIHIRKYLKQFSTQTLDIVQKFSCLIF